MLFSERIGSGCRVGESMVSAAGCERLGIIVVVVVVERDRPCAGREVDIARARAWACALGLMDEVSAGEGMFGFAGNPVLGVELLDVLDADVEGADSDVVEPETDDVM